MTNTPCALRLCTRAASVTLDADGAHHQFCELHAADFLKVRADNARRARRAARKAAL